MSDTPRSIYDPAGYPPGVPNPFGARVHAWNGGPWDQGTRYHGPIYDRPQWGQTWIDRPSLQGVGAPGAAGSNVPWGWLLLIGAVVAGTVIFFKEGGPGAVHSARRELDRQRTPSDARIIYRSDNGEAEKVRKRDGAWEYWYDGEWNPLKYYGGGGFKVVGDELVVPKNRGQSFGY